MLSAKPTVASLSTKFNTMVEQLTEIITRERANRDSATAEVERCDTEITAAENFRRGLGNLLSGE